MRKADEIIFYNYKDKNRIAVLKTDYIATTAKKKSDRLHRVIYAFYVLI